MSDPVTERPDTGQLIDEIGRLREQVAHLQERVAALDVLAHQDTLIKLPNRRGFMRELERLIDRARRYDHHAALLFVDLDGLKMINDSFGHAAGDEALKQVAQLLSGGVRRSDVVARIGGDEFAILLENASEDSAHETAERLVDLVCGCEFRHDGDALPLSVAIGVAMIDGAAELEAVLAAADEEMYRRKDAA
jgi:diguanylate cyclase (GGDEF)-like protein